METMYQFLALMSFISAIITLLGVALYYLDNWLDQDETTERATNAKHRA